VTLFVLNQPIANQERCQGCHGTDHKVRAVVRVATSMEPVLAQVAMQRNRQITIAILTIVTAAAVLAVAMRFVVVRPIHELTRVARRIGDGDFQARAPASGDEVGELGTALNDMTMRLSEAQQDLGARNTELATALENLQASRQSWSCWAAQGKLQQVRARRRRGLAARPSDDTGEAQRGGSRPLSRHRRLRAWATARAKRLNARADLLQQLPRSFAHTRR
jgi:HAMP domain-containing protein